MDDHNCVRNPETGKCYVCCTPMRLTFWTPNPLDRAIDAALFPDDKPSAPRPAAVTCANCHGGRPVQGESLCLDCWIAEQTKPRAPKPKPVKQTKPASITLDSILDAMKTNPSKWN
jgi:hypothetical protein